MKRSESGDGAACIGTPAGLHGHGVQTHSMSAQMGAMPAPRTTMRHRDMDSVGRAF